MTLCPNLHSRREVEIVSKNKNFVPNGRTGYAECSGCGEGIDAVIGLLKGTPAIQCRHCGRTSKAGYRNWFGDVDPMEAGK